MSEGIPGGRRPFVRILEVSAFFGFTGVSLVAERCIKLITKVGTGRR